MQYWCLYIFGISGKGKARCFVRVTWLRCKLARSAPFILTECKSAGFKQESLSFGTIGVTRGGVLLTALSPVVSGQSTTFWFSIFATALSSVENQLNHLIRYKRTMFRFQRGCCRVCLQFARPARLTFKPVSYRPPRLSRQHHLEFL